MGREKGIDPDKVAIYIRWSTDDQADGTTLEVQLEGCKHYLLSQGWVVNEDLVFVDDGYSGGNMERPALTRMRSFVRSGGIDCVVVFKLDRLSRSVIDMVNLVLEEWEGLTHVKSAREPLDTSSAMGKQFFYMLVSFAEWERSVIRERTTAGRLARAKEGYKASAKAPYGFCHGKVKGSYEIVPEEAQVVQRIFELYNGGLGAKGVVTRLNSEGVRNRSGEMWNERTVLFMVSNPAYIGKMVYGRISKNPRHGKVAGELYWVKNEQVTVVENSPFVPAIVSEDVFSMAQQVKAFRRPEKAPKTRSPRTLVSPYLLTGLAKCKCGYSLYARLLPPRRGGPEYRYYSCLGKKIKGRVFCDAPYIPMDLLDNRVRQEVLARYGSRVSREQYRDVLLADLDRSLAQVAAALTQVDQRIARLESQERQVRVDYREQVITASEFRALRKDLMDDLHKVREQRQQLLTRRLDVDEKRQALSLRLQAFEQVDRWADLGAQEQKNLLGHFVDHITASVSTPNRELLLHIAWHGVENSPSTD
jgi:site-specific DNA recombinase